ncbi:MAG TPA: SDR family NAD(P)-dependent oxidoreductase, partial [Thermodesulfobacteriota bacterium]|nr:SDR family NAD(P)-dependent oxidoreductase [Thermodesulfobacteriota bacterium]
MRLSGKTAIVTGAAKGLGRAFCLGLVREGARILAVTRKDLDNLNQTVKMIRSMGGEAELFQADVSIESETQ